MNGSKVLIAFLVAVIVTLIIIFPTFTKIDESKKTTQQEIEPDLECKETYDCMRGELCIKEICTVGFKICEEIAEIDYNIAFPSCEVFDKTDNECRCYYWITDREEELIEHENSLEIIARKEHKQTVTFRLK